MKQIERIHLLSRADALKPLRHILSGLIKNYEFSIESANNIIMALNEACMNIIQHAYGDQDNGEIIIDIFKLDKGMLIRVVDYATHSDISKIKSRNLDEVRPGGLGVHLIHSLVDKVEYKNLKNESGNMLELYKIFDNDECVKG